MGKYSKYTKKYNPDWEKLSCFSGWLQKAYDSHSDRGEAYCKLCRTTLRAHKTDLIKHAKTKTHSQRADSLEVQKQPTLKSFGMHIKSNDEKIRDLKLAFYIASHSSIRTIDHLGELLKDMDGPTSSFNTLELNRTKCSKLIINVIAPCFLKELVQDVRNGAYSIIIDESTDICTYKYMAFCIRYYSQTASNIITNFLGFVEIEKATAEILKTIFLDFLTELSLNVNNLISIGTDGASNLCGKNKSLFTLLRDEVPLPNLQLIKCICHSLNICAANACGELPNALEFLIRESRSWFSHSTLRQLAYKDIFKTLNEGKLPPKIVQLSTTRWLSWYDSVKATLSQWLPLSTHFELISQSKNACYTSRTLYAMFTDDTNLLYLLFLKPILHEVIQVNLVFQGTNVDLSKAYSDMKMLLISLVKRILKPQHIASIIHNNKDGKMISMLDIDSLSNALRFPDAHLPLNSIDFGAKFQKQIEISKTKKTLSQEQCQIVMQRSSQFIFRLCREIINRLPHNVVIMEKLRNLSPLECLSGTLRPSFSNLPLELAGNDIDHDILESQWRKLGTLKYVDIFPDKSITDVTLIECWVEISKLKTASGEKMFKELSDFVFRVLTLPVSNAVVERVFSVMNTTKTKLRNRMSMELLVALIRIKIHSKVNKFCCTSFTPSKDMLNLFNSKIYDYEKSETTALSKDLENDIFDTVELFSVECRQ